MLHVSSRENPQNSRRILSTWADADILSQIIPNAASAVRDSAAWHQFNFFSPVSRGPSVFGHRSPASGSECPIAAFPGPWGYSFRGVIGSSPLAGKSADFGAALDQGLTRMCHCSVYMQGIPAVPDELTRTVISVYPSSLWGNLREVWGAWKSGLIHPRGNDVSASRSASNRESRGRLLSVIE